MKYTQGEKATAVANYTLAVDRRFKRGGEPTADFIRCIAFGKNGEFAEKYLKQGIKIAVEGHIQTGSYTNKDGQKVFTTDVIVASHEFCESKKVAEENSQAAQPVGAPAPQTDSDGFMQVPDGVDELPFN